jgi:hypothetical protein
MLVAGTESGAYGVTGVTDGGPLDVEVVLDAPRVERVRQFDAVDGVFAATSAGLYYSPDGRDWGDLAVPVDPVWAVTVSPDGERIYAGTVPTHVFVASLPGDGLVPQSVEWRKLEGFRELPSRDDWGVPRHDGKARVRDLCIHRASPGRVVAGVEPGGVHASVDGGVTWAERDTGVHEDVHSLHVVADGEYVAATGRGLYRTTDAGRSWMRLDDGVDQRYFRTVYEYEGVLYASAACVPPSNRWETREANPALFASRDGRSLERLDSPRPDEVVVGWTATEGALVGATHRGTIIETDGETWRVLGTIPTTETIPGCYYNLAWIGS